MKLKKTIYKFSSSKISSEFYKNSKGQRHGPFTSFWSNGQKDYEGSFICGRRIGMWKVYYSDERRLWIVTWKNDISNGVRIVFK